MKTLFVNRNLIVSILAVMLLIYSVQGISYGQGEAPPLRQARPTRPWSSGFRLRLTKVLMRMPIRFRCVEKRLKQSGFQNA